MFRRGESTVQGEHSRVLLSDPKSGKKNEQTRVRDSLRISSRAICFLCHRVASEQGQKDTLGSRKQRVAAGNSPHGLSRVPFERMRQLRINVTRPKMPQTRCRA